VQRGGGFKGLAFDMWLWLLLVVGLKGKGFLLGLLSLVMVLERGCVWMRCLLCLVYERGFCVDMLLWLPLVVD